MLHHIKWMPLLLHITLYIEWLPLLLYVTLYIEWMPLLNVTLYIELLPLLLHVTLHIDCLPVLLYVTLYIEWLPLLLHVTLCTSKISCRSRMSSPLGGRIRGFTEVVHADDRTIS
jgi:hypothetical protein